MIIARKTTCPYIASRNPGETTYWVMIYEGSIKHLKDIMLRLFNEKMNAPYMTRLSDAIRWCNKQNTIDGLSNHGKRFDYDSRIYEIMTKKEMWQRNNIVK